MMLICLPLRSPLHQSISQHHGREPVENLMCCSSSDVEDGGMHSACERSLLVGGECICNDALLRWRACSGGQTISLRRLDRRISRWSFSNIPKSPQLPRYLYIVSIGFRVLGCASKEECTHFPSFGFGWALLRSNRVACIRRTGVGRIMARIFRQSG